jgi:methionine-rich copper-binding protein CopC
MRKFIAIAVLACLGVFQGAPAHAHNSLTSTSPARGAMLNVAPTEVMLTFDLPFIGGQSANVVTVTNASGERVDNDDSLMEANTLHATLQELPSGTYTVNFRIVSEDGHPVSNSYQFGVTLPEPSQSATPVKPTPSAKPTPQNSHRSKTPSPSPSQSEIAQSPTPSAIASLVPSSTPSAITTIAPTRTATVGVQSTNANKLWSWLIPTILVTIGAGYFIRKNRHR